MPSFDALGRLVGAVPADVVTALRVVERTQGRLALDRQALPGMFDTLTDRARSARITASAALDGVVVEDAVRAADLLAGGDPRDADEQVLAGVRDGVDLVAARPPGGDAPVDTALVRRVHRAMHTRTPTPGGTLRREEPPVLAAPPAHARVKQFTPVPAAAVEGHLDALGEAYRDAQDAGRHHPVLLVGLFVLDLLAVHPFTRGNGRVARAVTHGLLLDAGYDVTRYVALEPTMVASGHAYALSLLDSTRGWHRAGHDPWPWLRHLVGATADASSRLTHAATTAREGGSKQDRVRRHVLRHSPATFTIGDVRDALPGVSDQTIRLVLAQLKAEGSIAPDGLGRAATWSRTR